MAESCATCKFYAFLEEQCRRYPPKVVSISHPYEEGEIIAKSLYPDAYENEWCGEYIARD